MFSGATCSWTKAELKLLVHDRIVVSVREFDRPAELLSIDDRMRGDRSQRCIGDIFIDFDFILVRDEDSPHDSRMSLGEDVIRHSLLKISRVRLGGLSFEGLAMGGWRDLTKAEAADLRRRAGVE